VADISLLASTGNQQVDKILQGIIGIYELVFPGCIRGYYLLGSYTDATSVSISDIDMAILFKGSSVDKREAQVNRCCSLISPIRLDISAHSEERLPAEDVRLKLGSVLLYGEDSRDNIALPPIEASLAFENHYLAIYRNYLLASLHSESLGDRLFAVRRLREVVYSDEKVTNSLYALAAADNEDLREAVQEAIGKIR